MGLAPGELAPLDEYDGYAPHIVSMVNRGATPAELADHLDGLRTDDTTVSASTASLAGRIVAAVGAATNDPVG